MRATEVPDWTDSFGWARLHSTWYQSDMSQKWSIRKSGVWLYKLLASMFLYDITANVILHNISEKVVVQ